jgi:hypothetical protein
MYIFVGNVVLKAMKYRNNPTSTEKTTRKPRYKKRTTTKEK